MPLGFIFERMQIPQIAEKHREAKVIDRALESDSARPRQVRCRHEKVIVVLTIMAKRLLKVDKEGASCDQQLSQLADCPLFAPAPAILIKVVTRLLRDGRACSCSLAHAAACASQVPLSARISRFERVFCG